MAGSLQLWTLYFVIFVDLFQLFFVVPLLPSLVTSFGGTVDQVATQVSILSTMGSLGEAVGCPIIGVLSDRFGRRPVMMLATMGSAISAVLFGFSTNIQMAVLARVINGLSGGTMGVAQSYVSDITTPEERPDAMNMVTAALSLGISAGPALGGVLYGIGGIKVACYAAGGVSLLNFFLILLFLRESNSRARGTADSEAGATSARVAVPCSLYCLFCCNFFTQPIMAIFDTFGNLFVMSKFFDGDEKHATGFFTTCMAGIGIVLFIVSLFLYKPVSKLLGFNATLSLGGVLAVAGLIGLGLAPNSELFRGSMFVMVTGMQFVGPSIPVMISTLAPPQEMGKMFGLMQSSGNIARVVAPTAFSPIYNWKHEAIWYLGASFYFIVVTIVLVLNFTRASPAPASAPLAEPREDEDEHLMEGTPTSRWMVRATSGGSCSLYGHAPCQFEKVISDGCTSRRRTRRTITMPDRAACAQAREGLPPRSGSAPAYSSDAA